MINKILWGLATSLIILSGIYFSLNLKFVQFRFKEMFKNLFKKNKKEIGPIQTLMMSLAGRIGVGSIAGIGIAIYIGGIGSLFWMWITTFLCAPNTFSETVLGIIYKEKDEDNIYKGGPSYYIKKGLSKNLLSKIYAILIIICYIGGFLGIQANTITKSINEIININPIIVGIIIALITFIIIYGGVKKIIKATTILVPIMTILYLLFALIVVFLNIDKIPIIFLNILKEAFKFKPFFTGFLTTFIVGLQRGIFSNEAGLGTSSIASSTTTSNDSVSTGFVQMLGIYITTLLICTASAIIILTSDYQNLILSDVNGIEIAQFAFKYHFGYLGEILMFISIFLFSFSTIITGYYYSNTCLKFIFKNHKKYHLNILKILTLLILFLGCIISSTFLWNFVDTLVAILVIINIFSILKLKREVKDELDYYDIKKCDKI